VDDRHHRIEHIGDALGGSLAFDECVGVARVLHEQQQLAFGLGVQEQGAGTDVGPVGDLLGGDLINAVFGEELESGGGDAVELVLLVPLAPSDRWSGQWHDRSFRNRL